MRVNMVVLLTDKKWYGVWREESDQSRGVGLRVPFTSKYAE